MSRPGVSALWVIVHNPDDYDWADVYGPFADRATAEKWGERFAKQNDWVDADDVTAREMQEPS